MKRWRLATLLVTLALVAAACGDDEDDAAGPIAAEDASGTVQVFSWWTGGGEAAGLTALTAVFAAKYPNVKFDNQAVAGGAGTNARAVLASRLQANDPPDSWQGHAGQELIGTYVVAGQIEPLNDLFKENGWLEVMPETLIPLISKDGSIYSVPVNIHRANVLWYNPAVLKANEIEGPIESVADFEAALEKLKGAGVIPLAMGEQWTSMHLFETALLASLGANDYEGLWSGKTDWAGDKVTKALETYNKWLGYTNTDATGLTWQDAAKLVVDGQAGFNIMGDWAEGYFKEIGKTPMEGFGWQPVPGTQGNFQFLSDSFTLAKNAPDRDAALAWLTVAGSKEGQDAFNPVKGSIPARRDADRSLYDEYLQSAMDDWSKDRVVGSLTHGVVANDGWKAEIDTAIGLFLSSHDVANFQKALDAACASAGTCT